MSQSTKVITKVMLHFVNTSKQNIVSMRWQLRSHYYKLLLSDQKGSDQITITNITREYLSIKS